MENYIKHYCWFCKCLQPHEQMGEGQHIYLQCVICKATSTSAQPKRRKK